MVGAEAAQLALAVGDLAEGGRHRRPPPELRGCLAAAELKERIASSFAEETGSRDGLADLYVGTIHAFCLGLLQQHDFRVLSYRVLTDVHQRLLISRNSRNCVWGKETRFGREGGAGDDGRSGPDCASC